MPKRPKFNTPIRRDVPPNDSDFVEVAHTDVPGAAEVAGAVVSSTAHALKGAAAAAVVTAAINYAESAAVSYTLETVGVTTLVKGAYVCVPPHPDPGLAAASPHHPRLCWPGWACAATHPSPRLPWVGKSCERDLNPHCYVDDV